MSRKLSPYILENIEIIDIGSEGKSIAKQNGMVIFVPFGVPGDIVDIRIIKKRKGYMEGIITQIKQPSPLRIPPRCTHFGVCGGCKWQILPYQQQLQFKQQQIHDNFKHLGKFEFPEMEPILGSENEYYYRNKLEFTFSDSRWLDQEDLEHRDQLNLNGLGFHVPGKFDKVVDIEHCYLQEDPAIKSDWQLKASFSERNSLLQYQNTYRYTPQSDYPNAWSRTINGDFSGQKCHS